MRDAGKHRPAQPEKDPRGPGREPRLFHGGLLAFARLERRGAGGREPQWYGLLPVLATALYSAVIVHPRCNARWIKASTAVCTMMWAVYSLFIRNYVYVLTNVITSASAVLFLLRSRKHGETTV